MLTTESTLAQALEYARDRRWSVFPVDSAEKRPLILKWTSRASTEEDTIDRWWRKWPDAGIGIVTGQVSQLCVVDIDSDAALTRLQAEGPIPDTLTVETGRGIHLYFQTVTDVPNRTGLLCPGIDIRGNGGFVIAPPSLHHSGKRYTWRDLAVPLTPLPGWLEERILFPVSSKKPTVTYGPKSLSPAYIENVQQFQLAMLRNAPEGMKHGTLLDVSMRIAGLVKTGWSDQPTQTEAMCQALRENASPVKDWQNVDKTIASAFVKARPENPLNQVHTEYSLALRFAAQAHDYKHLWQAKDWLRFKAGVWRQCPQPSLKIANMLVAMADEPPAPGIEPETHQRSLRRFQSARALSAIGSLAADTPELLIEQEHLDRHPHLLNTPNGTVDLETGKLRPHDPADLLTLITPYPYDANATCPQWLKALDMYTGGDGDLAQYLQRLTGSCLVRKVVDEKFWLFSGSGSNGKTAYIETTTSVMGPYAKPTTASSLIVRQNEQHTSSIGALAGTGLVYVEELEKGATLDMDKLKRYFGRSPIRVQLQMGGNFVDLVPTWKLIISSNHDPHFPDNSEGARRRFTVVPFDRPIQRRDLHFTDKLLKAEATGIFRWLVDGALAYLRDGLGTCAAVEARTAKFHADQDPLTDFLADCCVIEPGVSAPFRALYLAYVDYATEAREKVLSKKAMGNLLNARGFLVARSSSERGRSGLTLKKDLASQYIARMLAS
jgi:phage/plasmid primase, P4 family, C-terminal domain